MGPVCFWSVKQSIRQYRNSRCFFQNLNSHMFIFLGTYADVEGLARSRKCPKGTFSTEIAAISSNVCQKCKAGTYSSTWASIKCIPCEVRISNLVRAVCIVFGLLSNIFHIQYHYQIMVLKEPANFGCYWRAPLSVGGSL